MIQELLPWVNEWIDVPIPTLAFPPPLHGSRGTRGELSVFAMSAESSYSIGGADYYTSVGAEWAVAVGYSYTDEWAGAVASLADGW